MSAVPGREALGLCRAFVVAHWGCVVGAARYPSSPNLISTPLTPRSEAAEKKKAAERYAKAHAAGQTEQAKSDLARLQEIRKKRDAAAAQRKAEQEGWYS